MDRNSSPNTRAPKFVFFGGADFSGDVLARLLGRGWHPSLVITNPSQPVGRRQQLSPSPVFNLANQRKLPVIEVANLKGHEIIAKIREANVPLGILVGLGMIVPQNLIDAFSKGIVNVHPSLLPKWRGPSPIQYSLLNGDSDTGVSLMLLDQDIDHGPVLAQEKVSIASTETYLDLAKRLAEIGVRMLIDKIPGYLSDKTEPKSQDHSQATFCKIIKREDGKIDWFKPAQQIYNQWRAFTPWPGIYTSWQEKRLKLIKIALTNIKSPTPGLVTVENDEVLIGCADYYIEVLELQLEGGKPLAATDFLKGHNEIAKSQLQQLD